MHQGCNRVYPARNPMYRCGQARSELETHLATMSSLRAQNAALKPQAQAAEGSRAEASTLRQHLDDAQAAEAVCSEALAARLRAALPPFAAWRQHGDLLEHLEEPAEAEAVACLAMPAGSTAAGEDVYGALCFNYLARGAPGSGDADAATDGGQAVEWIVVPNEHKAAAAPHCNPHRTATRTHPRP